MYDLQIPSNVALDETPFQSMKIESHFRCTCRINASHPTMPRIQLARIYFARIETGASPA